jgi:hypothetical protein
MRVAVLRLVLFLRLVFLGIGASRIGRAAVCLRAGCCRRIGASATVLVGLGLSVRVGRSGPPWVGRGLGGLALVRLVHDFRAPARDY